MNWALQPCGHDLRDVQPLGPVIDGRELDLAQQRASFGGDADAVEAEIGKDLIGLTVRDVRNGNTEHLHPGVGLGIGDQVGDRGEDVVDIYDLR